MDNPIISPWLIYLIFSSGSIKAFFYIFAFSLIVGSISTGISGLVTMPDLRYCSSEERADNKIKENQRYKKTLFMFCKRFTIVGTICLMIASFFPSSDAMIGIAAANIVTRSNLIAAGDTVCDIKDAVKGELIDVIDIIKGDVKVVTKSEQGESNE